MTIQDRYAGAVNSKNLTVDERTRMSDTDVLTAYAWTSRRHPLAVDLERLFMGDNHAVHNIVEAMTQLVYEHSFKLRVKISRHRAEDMAKACLAWHRNGTCRVCGGHGYSVIEGAPMLSERECHACGGAGKINLERQFDDLGHRELARWLVAELARHSNMAGPEAMRKLGPTLEL